MKLCDIFTTRVNWTNNQDQRGEKKPGYIYSGHWAGQADALTQEKVQDILRLLTLPVTSYRGAPAAIVCRSESALQQMQFNFKTNF